MQDSFDTLKVSNKLPKRPKCMCLPFYEAASIFYASPNAPFFGILGEGRSL